MLTRYDPFHTARELRNEINRAFGASMLGDSDDSSNVVTSRWAPAVDVQEEADAFVISADIPGVEPEATRARPARPISAWAPRTCSSCRSFPRPIKSE